MKIKSSSKEYEVFIFDNFAPVKNLVTTEKDFVVVDGNIYQLYREELFSDIPEKQLYVLEAVEENKTIETALSICEIMTMIPAKRNARLISFGGGIIQDITGFVANILYRGIYWTFFPTTLLSACDSCIGSKTSLNYKNYKNLLGTFYPPDEINICSPFFKTLTERDFQSGLGEVVKFNVMYGEKGLSRIEERMDALLLRDEAVLDEFLRNSLLFKKPFIEEDEFDRGVRIQLNFAHTFGHAFETISHYAIPHGTAVAMGTVTANRISLSRGWLTGAAVERMEKILWRIIHVDAMTDSVSMRDILAAIRKDKKQIGKELTAVLMKDSGSGSVELVIVHDVKEKEIEEGVSYLFEKLGIFGERT